MYNACTIKSIIYSEVHILYINTKGNREYEIYQKLPDFRVGEKKNMK